MTATVSRVVVFSDVHLGTKQCNRDAFSKFVQQLGRDTPDGIVIDGDLVDFWRRSNAEVLTENKEVLRDLFGLSCDIAYVVGNHDYAIWDVADRHSKDVMWPSTDQELGLEFCRDSRFQCGENTYYVTHGYDLDVAVTMEYLPLETYEAFAAAQCRADDTLGSAASLLWDAITIAGKHIPTARKVSNGSHEDIEYRDIYDVANSGAAHLLLGCHPGDRLIYGHTHYPYITKDGQVANTGSWCTEAGLPVHNTYVEITENGMTLERFGVPA